MADSESLMGKRAVVTGATRGIGRSIALKLAEAGADVAVSARGEADLVALRGEIESRGRRALAVTCDVTDAQQVNERLAKGALDAWGGVDILVNNAGNAGSAKFLGHPDELWQRMLAINLTSVYYVTKAFAPAMVAQGSGRIITIASIAGKVGGKYITAYTASKHGVIGLTRALAVELNQHGITVNAICPGYVDTPMTDASVSNMVARTGMSAAEARQALERMSPQRRLIEPDEVASVALFLALDSSKGITGQAINVDGGEVNY
ncbi:MAG: SDR family NAD(P)-dependent oxidoreductase [Ktedonobacterales bacterium]|jgi:NAD(P)-dependent dehydrogenase (short-subunit alcohol dehydrogenase family)